MARLLLVEDDAVIGQALRDVLVGQRHEVHWSTDGKGALAAAEQVGADLVVLDLGLPDLHGLDVCRALRTRLPAAVIVILTALDAEVDVVVGLESGADDYLVKPVPVAELTARVRAHLRRAGALAASPERVDSLRLDRSMRRAWLGDHEIPLRTKEFDLLSRLVAEPEVALERATLMADVWDANWYGSTKTLDVHVAALRRKLHDAESAVGLPAPQIDTLRGYGYRLVPRSADPQAKASADG